MTGDMIKILKSCFFKKQFFTFNFSKKCKNWHFLKKQFFSFLIISPVIFDLQKRTIPQIKALNILFWPYFIHFIARMDIWWAMKPRKCPVFFAPDFRCPRAQKNKKWKSSYAGNRSYPLTSAGRSTNHGPRRRFFIFCFSEPLGINIEGYEGLVHCTRLFIQIRFGLMWHTSFSLSKECDLFFYESFQPDWFF